MKTKMITLLFITVYPLLAENITLSDAVKTALQNNKKHLISEQDIAIAQTKYKQALSADYPTLDVSGVLNRHDEKFIDHTETSFTIPGMGTLPVSYDHTIMGRDTAYAEAKVQYALYSGGKISALQKQAQEAIHYSKEGNKLTDDEIVRDVRKYYAGALLADNLEHVMQRTVDRIRAIYKLTDAFYKDGSLKVKKTDYLRTKLMLSTVESMLEEMKTNQKLAMAALIFSMGVDKNQSYTLVAEKTDKDLPQKTSLSQYYKMMYMRNHLMKQIESGLLISQEKIKESQSGYLPSVGVYAKAKTLYNNEKGGIINSTNNDSWDIGVAIKYNLFSGGLTKYKVQESKVKVLQFKAKEAYLKSALDLQVRTSYENLQKSIRQKEILHEAMKTARENADLNMRAYKHEMVETKDVIEAQIFESITEANYYKSVYDSYVQKAELEFVIAKDI